MMLTFLLSLGLALSRAPALVPPEDPADQPAGPSPAAPGPIAWDFGSFDDALARAQAEGQRVLVYLWAPGSEHCAQTFGAVFSDPAVVQSLADYTCVAASAAEPRGAPLVARYGVSVVPTMVFLLPDGSTEDALVGAISAASFRGELRRIEAGRETLSDFRRRVQDSPKNLAARLDLAAKLLHVGDRAGYEQTVSSIREADPRGRTEIGAQLLLRETMREVLEKANHQPADYRMEPVLRLLSRISHDTVAFEGWDWLAQRHLERGELAAARSCFEKALSHLDDTAGMDWGAQVVTTIWNDRARLGRKDRKFALELAQRTADLALGYLAQQGGSQDGTPSGKPNIDTQVAGKVMCLACAWALDGQPRRAREVLALVDALDPGNPELQQVRDEVLAYR